MVSGACIVVVLALTASFTEVKSKDSDACYKELGCFPFEEPWYNLRRPFPPPQTPTEINTQIYCYTSAKRPTAFITHGFFSSGNVTWVDDMKDAYLSMVDANVCKVDWGNGAHNINYLQVASNTRVVGAELARFIKFLQKNHGLKPSDLHLIGHSLGSHICAYAAKNVTKIKRITGLDVAQPGFEGQDNMTHLDKGDAEFVDAIHTNGAKFIPDRGLGFINPLGHVDIYMNDGHSQPGCTLSNIVVTGALKLLSGLSDLSSVANSALVEWSGCSHSRSYEYFTASLSKNCSIWGLATTMKLNNTFGQPNIKAMVEKCTASTCIPLGIHTSDFPGRGVFTANTPEEEPFCRTAKDNNAIVKRILAASKGLPKKLIAIIKGFSR